VEFIPAAFVVHLQDGRSLTVPIEWFPRLRDGTAEQRNHWRLIGSGIGIYWPDIDEDISAAGLLGFRTDRCGHPTRARITAWPFPSLTSFADVLGPAVIADNSWLLHPSWQRPAMGP